MAAPKTLEDIITEQTSIVCEQIELAVSFGIGGRSPHRGRKSDRSVPQRG
jgi:hypothetical protein